MSKEKEEFIKQHEQDLKDLAEMKKKYADRKKEMTTMNMVIVLYAISGIPVLFPDYFIHIKNQNDDLNKIMEAMGKSIKEIDNKIQYEGLLITLLDD